MQPINKNKELYKAYCQLNKNITVFESFNWLNTLLKPNDWDVLLSFEKNGEVRAAWPIFHKSKFGIRKTTIPILTPYIGPIITYPSDLGKAKISSYEKQLLNELIKELPNVDESIFHTNPHFKNWLPFYWKGFKQTTRYTYTLPVQNFQETQKNFKSTLRRELKKAQKSLTLHSTQDYQTLHQIKVDDYNAKKISLPYNLSYFQKIQQFVEESNQGALFQARNSENLVVASMLFLWDEKYFYYHTGAVLPQFRNSGAMTLLMNKGIEMACEKNLQFNFEGSMVEGIERYFSSFGAFQTPYFRIEKTNNKLLKLFNALKA
jgi:lipid II:glycine glycyltransferase (peptidoglycan interpeptide bridge formation enzyme)